MSPPANKFQHHYYSSSSTPTSFKQPVTGKRRLTLFALTTLRPGHIFHIFAMHALTNTGAVLLAVLLFFFLIFIAELSYIFCRGTGAFPDPPSTSKEVLLQLFMCCKKKNHHFRIEPTGIVSVQMEEDVVVAAAAVEVEEDVAAVDKWRVSRLLFTIEEDDLEMEDDDVVSVDKEDDNDGGVEIPVEYAGEPTPFLTPCDSPPYFTPPPTPGRDIDVVINVL